MLKVYSYFNSICTQKVFITLAEKSLPYTTSHVDLFKNEQFSPAYLKINPSGEEAEHARDLRDKVQAMADRNITPAIQDQPTDASSGADSPSR